MEIRSLWQEILKKSGDFKESYTILLPPPNITGSLHIGHFFNWGIQDLLMRYYYMKGKRPNWIPGIDHSAISTQIVVEKQLKEQGISRKDLGYDKFREKVFEWKEVAENLIGQQANEFGFFFDWEKRVFTMDPHYQQKVQNAFIKLFNDGLIKKNKRLTYWDPISQTALSDLELVEKVEKSKIYVIKYFTKSGKSINIATTRPETIFADTAIAVHPDDDRYKEFANETVFVPLINREVKVVFDSQCSIEKGTGALKVTPALDVNDYAIGERHNLEMIEIIDKNGCLFNVPDEFIGLNIAQARKLMLEKLQKAGNFVEEQEWEGLKYCAEKSENEVITILTQQWFLDVSQMAQAAVQRSNEVEFIPNNVKELFFHWMKNIKPWCISRQIWWGHQIPIWYKKDGSYFCAATKEEAQKIGGEEVVQETDVLDTWFSSALWPSAVQESFKQTDALVTGKDILFFWVARMIMFSLYFEGEMPFKKVYFNGIVRDEKRQKMSKTKGNVLNPLDIQKEYGNDALRFALLRQASWGKDIALKESDLKDGRAFATKFKNASKFIKDFISKDYNAYDVLDDWMESIIVEYKAKIETEIENFAFHEACKLLYDLFWNNFCAWYIEGMKYYPSANAEIFFFEILKIAHPIIPWVSEECYQMFSPNASILSYNHKNLIQKDRTNFERIISVVRILRKLKAIACLKSFSINNAPIKDIELIKNLARLKIDNDNEFIIKNKEYEIKISSQIAIKARAIFEKEYDELEEKIKFSQNRLKNNSNVPENIINEWNEKLIAMQNEFLEIKLWLENLA